MRALIGTMEYKMSFLRTLIHEHQSRSKECDALIEALNYYGVHLGDCNAAGSDNAAEGNCNCGLAKVLAKLESDK